MRHLHRYFILLVLVAGVSLASAHPIVLHTQMPMLAVPCDSELVFGIDTLAVTVIPLEDQGLLFGYPTTDSQRMMLSEDGQYWGELVLSFVYSSHDSLVYQEDGELYPLFICVRDTLDQTKSGISIALWADSKTRWGNWSQQRLESLQGKTPADAVSDTALSRALIEHWDTIIGLTIKPDSTSTP